MQSEYEIIIADTSCLILLTKISELELLRLLFGTVIIIDVIAHEYGEALPAWVHVKTVVDKYFQSSLDIDPGEASAIALAVESERSLLILDDKKARKAAQKLQLNYTGSLGIFLKAKEVGVIPALKPILNKIQQTNFRFSESIYKEVLLIAAE